ncbi:MAG TPA: hypothetical protein VGI78_28765 [Acetobacteraceae bacterium]
MRRKQLRHFAAEWIVLQFDDNLCPAPVRRPRLPGGTPVDDYAAQEVGENRRRIVPHGRSITFQMAEIMVPRGLFEQILSTIAGAALTL